MLYTALKVRDLCFIKPLTEYLSILKLSRSVYCGQGPETSYCLLLWMIWFGSILLNLAFLTLTGRCSVWKSTRSPVTNLVRRASLTVKIENSWPDGNIYCVRCNGLKAKKKINCSKGSPLTIWWLVAVAIIILLHYRWFHRPKTAFYISGQKIWFFVAPLTLRYKLYIKNHWCQNCDQEKLIADFLPESKMKATLPGVYTQTFDEVKVARSPANRSGHKILLLVTSARQNSMARWIIRHTAKIDPHAKSMVEMVFLLGKARPGKTFCLRSRMMDYIL